MKLLNWCDNFIKELIAPPRCCHCSVSGSFLCTDCYEQISFSTVQTNSIHLSPLDGIYWLTPFEGPVKSLIVAVKYKGQQDVSQTIADLLFHTAKIPNCEYITSVPAHHSRLKERGFNQSALIAKKLATLCSIPYLELLERTVLLTPQAMISDKMIRQQRQNQTMSSLTTQRHWLINLPPQTILIIDDVFTTGATLKEAARAIKECNPKLKVWGLTVAHA